MKIQSSLDSRVMTDIHMFWVNYVLNQWIPQEDIDEALHYVDFVVTHNGSKLNIKSHF